jgi:hypothetical protein
MRTRRPCWKGGVEVDLKTRIQLEVILNTSIMCTCASRLGKLWGIGGEVGGQG